MPANRKEPRRSVTPTKYPFAASFIQSLGQIKIGCHRFDSVANGSMLLVSICMRQRLSCSSLARKSNTSAAPPATNDLGALLLALELLTKGCECSPYVISRKRHGATFALAANRS
jgi:hypothetical protein